MKYAVVLFCIIVGVLGAEDEKDATVTNNNYEINADGSYRWAYETSNGISGQASGYVKEIEPNVFAEVVEGGNSYTAPDGQVISSGYTADENGYHPYGDHIPTSLPMPDYILKALEYIEKKNRS